MKIKTLVNTYKHIGFNRIKQYITYNIPSKSLKNEYAGTVDDLEYEGLVNLARMARQKCADGVIIEIGALFGLSTQAILEGGKNSKVIVIDNFQWNPIGLTSERHESMLRSNLRYFIRENRLEIFKGTSTDYIKYNHSNEKVAMVFIDADHSYAGVFNDINLAESLGAAIVCGDDYSFPGVKKAVQERYGNTVKFTGDIWWVER